MTAWRIGHVTEGPDLDKCKQFWRDYRAVIARDCEACWAWGQCRGPCPWDVARADGTFRLSPEHCDSVKRYIELAAYVYARKKDLDGKAAVRDAEIPAGDFPCQGGNCDGKTE